VFAPFSSFSSFFFSNDMFVRHKSVWTEKPWKIVALLESMWSNVCVSMTKNFCTCWSLCTRVSLIEGDPTGGHFGDEARCSSKAETWWWAGTQIATLNVSCCYSIVLWKDTRFEINLLTSENARCTLRQSVRAVERTSQRSNNHYRRRIPWGRPRDRRQWLSWQGSCHSDSKSKCQVHQGQWAISQDLLHYLRLYISASWTSFHRTVWSGAAVE